MNMSTFRSRGRRAISPIVATVLIVAVTLVASVAIAGFVFGVFGTSTNSAQVAVTAASLRSSDFLTTNAGITFTCGAATGSFLTISNTGTAGTDISSVTINLAESSDHYSLAAGSSCSVGAAGSASATQNILFASTTKLFTSANQGSYFQGYVTYGSGGIVPFDGTFQ